MTREREELDEIKRRYLAGKLTTEQAYALDTLWRLRLIQAERAAARASAGGGAPTA